MLMLLLARSQAGGIDKHDGRLSRQARSPSSIGCRRAQYRTSLQLGDLADIPHRIKTCNPLSRLIRQYYRHSSLCLQHMMVSKTGYMPSFPATGLAVDKHAAQCSWHLGRITSVIRPSCLKTRQKTCEAGGRVYAAIGNARYEGLVSEPRD